MRSTADLTGVIRHLRAPAGDGYQEFRRYVAGEHFAPQALPDLVIEVGALLGA